MQEVGQLKFARPIQQIEAEYRARQAALAPQTPTPQTPQTAQAQLPTVPEIPVEPPKIEETITKISYFPNIGDSTEAAALTRDLSKGMSQLREDTSSFERGIRKVSNLSEDFVNELKVNLSKIKTGAESIQKTADTYEGSGSAIDDEKLQDQAAKALAAILKQS